METYQIQIPNFFTNKAFRDKIIQITDKKELNRIKGKKIKKPISKDSFYNYTQRANENTIDIYTYGSRKIINDVTKAGYSIVLYDTDTKKIKDKEIG